MRSLTLDNGADALVLPRQLTALSLRYINAPSSGTVASIAPPDALQHLEEIEVHFPMIYAFGAVQPPPRLQLLRVHSPQKGAWPAYFNEFFLDCAATVKHMEICDKSFALDLSSVLPNLLTLDLVIRRLRMVGQPALTEVSLAIQDTLELGDCPSLFRATIEFRNREARVALEGCANLEELTMVGHSRHVEGLPLLPPTLSKLRILKVTGWKELAGIPPLTSLERIEVENEALIESLHPALRARAVLV